eukprot:TRINITY_DN7439_c0_g1_i1.p1 TRINITY_DN7439_c0_g1~~TRINITY_DN7439_c0_g1_i1.p1  ORF type:complete len:439 (-),score=88.79 TRINITY_DN7439_c0_g1_i1:184-1500(-)
MVVANAVAALIDIDEVSPNPVFVLHRSILTKLFAALEEGSEWGQCYLLNSLSRYLPKDGREAKIIMDKVTPVLQHANPAVVMGAIRIIVKFLHMVDNKEYEKLLIQKVKAPLVSMLNREPEVNYVALRNIRLILQRFRSTFSKEIHFFFCRYRDPIYIKIEKLEIMLMLVNKRNVDSVLREFKEYSSNVDVEFVRKVIKTIGRAALKLDKATDKCVDLLLDLIKTTKACHVIEESTIVMKDIFRKHLRRYEMIVPSLVEQCENLESPEARAALTWIIGEYAHVLEAPFEVLERYIEGFRDDVTMVQLQLLTSVVKLFLKKLNEEKAKMMLEGVLEMATNDVTNPDVRDRAFLYARLLSQIPEESKQIVFHERSSIIDSSTNLDEKLLRELILHISTLASVYHVPPSAFISRMKSPMISDQSFVDSIPDILETLPMTFV